MICWEIPCASIQEQLRRPLAYRKELKRYLWYSIILKADFSKYIYRIFMPFRSSWNALSVVFVCVSSSTAYLGLEAVEWSQKPHCSHTQQNLVRYGNGI